MSEPKTVHVWLQDGRSLCDRRASTRHSGNTTMEQLEALRRETEAAPACGPCLLLVSRLRREAAAIVRRHPVVWPERPSEAWASLEGTRWESRFDLAAFAERSAQVDATTSYSAFELAVDRTSVDRLIREHDDAEGDEF